MTCTSGPRSLLDKMSGEAMFQDVTSDMRLNSLEVRREC